MSVGEIVKDRGEVYQRRLRPLDLYERRGWITKRQSFAGDVLYWAWAIGIHGARPENDELPPEVRTPFGPRQIPIQRMHAIRRYQEAVTALGLRLAWVQQVCCDGVLASDIPERLTGVKPREVMTLLRHGLDRLADHWQNSS